MEIPTSDLFSESNPIKALQEKLKAVRHAYFNANNRQEKLRLQKQDKKLRKQIASTINDLLATKNEQDSINLSDRIASEKAILSATEKEPEQIEITQTTDLLGETVITKTDRKKEKLKAQKALIARLDKQLKKQQAADNKEAILKVAEQIATFDPYDQNHFANWFEPEWMFGITDGFDVVIGNPPYIQLQKDGGKLAKTLENNHYQTFERTGDIYVVFYEKAIQLLKENGNLCYITSNKWMRAGYGEKLRAFFAKQNPLLLIDLGPGVFENATVDTNILLLQKGDCQNQLNALTLQKDDKENIAQAVKEKAVKLHKLTKDAWFIGSNVEQQLKEKIERIGKPLKDWDVNIYYGVKTGLNEAFIITTDKRNEILANCSVADESCIDELTERQRTEAVIKPILRGRDIKRYYYEWAELWVIGTFPALKLNIDDYPALKRYLLDHFDIRQLDQSGKKYPELGFDARKKTGNKWYETQDQIVYFPVFEKEKVVWKRIGSVIRFTLDNEGTYPLDSNVIMTGKSIKYLCGYLNSKLSIKQLLENAPKTGTGDVIISVQALEPHRVPSITLSNEVLIRKIEVLVDKILQSLSGISAEKSAVSIPTNVLVRSKDASGTLEWERQIDELVFKLYELTYDEVKVVCPDFWLSEAEYETIKIE